MKCKLNEDKKNKIRKIDLEIVIITYITHADDMTAILTYYLFTSLLASNFTSL